MLEDESTKRGWGGMRREKEECNGGEVKEGLLTLPGTHVERGYSFSGLLSSVVVILWAVVRFWVVCCLLSFVVLLILGIAGATSLSLSSHRTPAAPRLSPPDPS